MLAMSLPGAAKALGLGDIRVDSALNEPLSAQIDIVGATREELVALTAKVANKDIFQRYGADRPSFLATATFKVGLDAQGHPVLNVRSAEAFTDPLVDFLVDLRWGNGELIREYSLLLDPAAYSPTPHGVVADTGSNGLSPTVPAPVAPKAGSIATATTVATALPASAADQDSPPAASPASHRVIAHDTLRGIARRAGARNELHAQRMMVAIFRANPHAFDGNINLLHLGAVLRMPAADEVSAINGAEAKREVRAQMTAWRLDGRPPAPRQAAVAQAAAPTTAPAAAAAVEPQHATNNAAATDALKNRVQSLEQALDDMHKQLASENARIQDLKQLASQATPPAAAAAVRAPAVMMPAVVAPAAAPAPPAPAVEAVAVAPAAHALKVEVMRATKQPAPVLAAMAPSQTSSGGEKTLLGPIAVALAIFLAGFAYFRKRLARTQAVPSAGAHIEEPLDAPRYAPRAVLPEPPPMNARVEAAPLSRALETPKAAAVSAPAPVSEGPALRTAADETTQNLAIDAEALERSYLELGIDSLGIDTVVFDKGTHLESSYVDATKSDTAKIETTGLETVAIDMTDLDTALTKADLNTVAIDASHLDTSHTKTDLGTVVAPSSTALDYNLLDLDATAQHVHMPSELQGHVVVAERRTNIAEVLKMAIERDPNRRDLRMKLLETYYSAAATNQRAFLEVVRKLAREREFLSAEDWKKVVSMGREIASDDILFADSSADDLADCA